MTEHDPDYGSYADFPVLVDPAITRVLDKARVYQHELDTNPAVTDERLQEVLIDLDKDWPCNQEVMRVSGRVRSGIVNYEVDDDDTDTQTRGTVLIGTERSEDGSQQMCDYTLNDQLLYSEGFITEWKPFVLQGEEIGRHHVIKLIMSRTVFVHVTDEEQPRPINLQCLSDIDSVSLQPKKEPFELTRLKSHEYFPECAETLEALNSEDLTPAEILMGLRDTLAPAAPWITNAELESLSQFAYEVSGIDHEDMPFLMTTQHDTPLFDSEDDEFDDVVDTMPECNAMVSVLGIRARPRVNFTRESDSQGLVEVDPSQVEFRLIAKMRQRDSVDDSEEFEVRLSDLKLIKNVRDIFYPTPPPGEEDQV